MLCFSLAFSWWLGNWIPFHIFISHLDILGTSKSFFSCRNYWSNACWLKTVWPIQKGIVVDFYCVHIAKWELCFPEFLSLSGSGLGLATKLTGDLESRRKASTFTLRKAAWNQALCFGSDLLAHLVGPGPALRSTTRSVPTRSHPSAFSSPRPDVCLAPWQRTQ